MTNSDDKIAVPCPSFRMDPQENAPVSEGAAGMLLRALGATAAVQPFAMGEKSGPGFSMEKVGDRIDRYDLLEKLGEGGFGIVWRAEQIEPVRREVALKVIKPGMDSREIIARFEAERQALAMMDHPNIAAVLDAGTTENGRPYFAMELVRGLPITEYCDDHKFTIRQRMELFVPVCQAVQHAHQKAILHRDLKPSNILIAEVDGRPVPKIIDFGIAKALGTGNEGVLHATLLRTQDGLVVGTPQYMSPEQAGSVPDLDTRSDIYTLGVILFELLTGKTPLSREQLRNAAFDELLRLVREGEAPRPSSRFVPVTDLMRQTSAMRGTEPTKLKRILSGDLDWITLKALEKERERRYGSAAALAQDIERHLRDEPVEAGPPSTTYRLGKLVRRNLVAVGTSLLIALSLISGVAMSTWQWREAVSAKVRSDEVLTMMQLQRAEELFEADDSGGGLAYLAAVLRRHPDDRVTSSRLLSGLIDRSYARPLLRPLRHPGNVTALAWSPDKKYLVAVTKDHVHLWDAKMGVLVTPPSSLNVDADLRKVRFSADGNRFVVTGMDSQVFDTKTGTPVSTALVHPGRMAYPEYVDAIFLPDGKRIVTSAHSLQVIVWDIQSGKQLAKLPIQRVSFHGSQHPVAMMMHPDGIRLAIEDGNATIQIWNTTSYQVERTWKCPLGANDHGTDLRFSPDGSRLFVNDQNSILGYDVKSGEALPWRINPHERITTYDLSPDGNTLAVATVGYTVRFYSAQTGEDLGRSWAQEEAVYSIRYADSGARLMTASKHAVRMLDLLTGNSLCSSLRSNSDIECVSMTPDGMLVAAGMASGEVRLWEMSASEERPLLFGQGVYFPPCILSADGSKLATSLGSHLSLWNFRDGRHIGTVDVGDSFWAMSIHPSGHQMVTGGVTSGQVNTWDSVTGRKAAAPLGKRGALGGLFFSADGSRLCIMDSAGAKVQVWNYLSRQPITALSGNHIGTCAMTPDGQRVVFVEQKTNDVKILDVGTGKLVEGSAEYEASIGQNSTSNQTAFALSPDGQFFAAGSSSGRVRVWRTKDARAVSPWLQHQASVASVQFSAHGDFLATASEDQSARVWSVNDGKPVGAAIRFSQSLISAVLSPDGQRLATASQDGAVRIWDVKSGRPLSDRLLVYDRGIRFAKNIIYYLQWPQNTSTVLGGGSGMVHKWDVEAYDAAIPSWLPDWAEAVAGKRIGQSGDFEEFDEAACASTEAAIAAAPQTNAYARAAKWFYADRTTRSIAPESHVSAEEYAEILAGTNSARVIEALLRFEPRNAHVWARYVELNLDPSGGPKAQPPSSIQHMLSFAESLDPKDSWTARAHALALNQSSRQDEALDACRHAAERDPKDWRTQRLLALLLANKDENAAAVDAATRALAGMAESGYDTSRRKQLIGLRRGLLMKLGRTADAAVDNLELLSINRRDPKATPKQIDLSAYFNASLDEDLNGDPSHANPQLADIPRGLQEMGGVLFDVRGVVRFRHPTAKHSPPDGIFGIRVAQSCHALHFLHSCLHISSAHGSDVASYVVTYEDGMVETVPVRAGLQIGNIYRADGKPPPPPLELGWMGETADTRRRSAAEKKPVKAVLYKATWQNPHPEMMVKSIDFVSGAEDAAPFLMAITAE